MRDTIIALVVAVAILVPAQAHANGMPPDKKGSTMPGAAAESAKVSMSDIQPDAPAEYTVAKGDTLWGIAGRFLKDPWKWPQVWQMNREQIKNPHLIYPGDIVRLDRSGIDPTLSIGSAGGFGGGEGVALGNVVRLQPRIRTEALSSAVPSIPGNAIGPFLSQPLVVDEGGLDNAPTIVATEESRVVVGAGNTAYADRIGTADGINWQVFRPGAALRDPETNELLGYEAKYIGDARVKRFGNPTTIEITKAREEINRGDRLAPARESTYPSYVPRAPDKPIKGAIMSVDGGVAEFGQYQIITINRGSRDGIEVGHVLASYRRGESLVARTTAPDFFGSGGGFWNSATTFWGGTPVPVVPESPAAVHGSGSSGSNDGKSGKALADQPIVLPDERNGVVFVFRVFEKMSYAMVMKSNRPIYLGDIVQTP